MQSCPMKRKTIFTVVLGTITAVGLVVGGYFTYRSFTSKSDGKIEIKVIDLDNTLIKDKEIEYKIGNKLSDLVINNFDNVTITNGMVMTIESLTTPADWSTFISIYINGEMSNYGINDLPFSNGDVISFINTEFIYEY